MNKSKLIYFLFIFTIFILIMFSNKSYSRQNKNSDNIVAEVTYLNTLNEENELAPIVPANKIIIRAYEFEIDGNKNIILAKGGVKIYETNLYLSGNNAVYDQNKNIVKIDGNIKLNYKDFKVKCQKVSLYGYGDRRIEAVNGVVFNYRDINGKSDTAIFYPKERKMKLNGNAIAQSRKNQLSGQEILIYIDQKRIISRGNSVVTISKTKK